MYIYKLHMRFALIILTLLVSGYHCSTHAQDARVVDQIVAVVGQNIVLESDIENQYYQYRMQSGAITGGSSIRCEMLESMLVQKLLLHQAEIDSIVVSDLDVKAEMDRRLRFFIAQIGSRERFEEYYGKSIEEFKEDFSKEIENQLKAGEVQNQIESKVNITPSEVRAFFRKIPTDSIPLINSVVEIGELVKMPPVSLEQKLEVKERLRGLRERVLAGESFATLAILYSEDPGSAKNGGELGFYGRGELYKEFEAVAFRLKKGEVSDIVETKAGFHILQMIERKGEFVNVRHILLKTKVSPVDLARSKAELDSIANLISMDSIGWDEAVLKFSDSENKNGGGLRINPSPGSMNAGSTAFEMSELEPKDSFVIDKLKVGEVSQPVVMETEDGRQAYRLLYLKTRTLPHRATLDEDYDRIKEWAMREKQDEVFREWLNKKARKSFIRINDKFLDCEFQIDWVGTTD